MLPHSVQLQRPPIPRPGIPYIRVPRPILLPRVTLTITRVVPIRYSPQVVPRPSMANSSIIPPIASDSGNGIT